VQQLVYAYWVSPFYVLGALLAALGPFSMAYAIVRHRVFDLGVIVRQSLRYAAAKGILLALAPFFGAVLVADLALHSNQTMAQAFAQRGWLYAVLGIAALAAHRMRKSWMITLDRRFYRERYDAQRILRSVLTQVRQAATLEEAAPQTVAQIDAALHPQFAAIMMRRSEGDSFGVVASSGESRVPDIPAESKFIALVRLLGKPLELQQSDTDWLRRQLPAEETGWLKASRIEWIYPVSLGANRTEVLLALASKRSEEPYTQEDQDLIEGIASGLGLLAERVSSFSPARSAKQEQPTGKVPDIAGRYTIRRELGRGGMGTVYEAQDTELQRGVAIKVMNPELIASQEAVARFKSEARAAAAFSHPNVVTVYDFGFSSDARAYLVMELLSGRTLRHVLRVEGRLELPRGLAVMRGVCAAVESAHRIRLLHRDLKPENIFLARSGGEETPKVLDFGVAKALKTEQDAATQADTAPGQLLGTLAYMSPEQLKGFQPAPSWDLWALAIIGYEMVTGAHPFAGAGLALHAAVLASRITPVRVHIPDAAAQWDAFFARALAAEPADRPGSARELFAEFEELANRRKASSASGAE
jgi:serine/threonine-protein kinase